MEKNWFTVKQVLPNVWGIAEFKYHEKVISYLFVGEKKALLFDSGMGIGDIYAELRKITELPAILINSHSHYDHVGGNKQFTNILHPSNRQIIHVKPFTFTALYTPGHTPDSICLYETRKKILLTGDTMYPGPIYLFFPESDFEAYKKSIQKLIHLEIDTLLPGHNAFFQDKEIFSIIEHKIQDKIISNEKVLRVDENVSLLLSNPGI